MTHASPTLLIRCSFADTWTRLDAIDNTLELARGSEHPNEPHVYKVHTAYLYGTLLALGRKVPFRKAVEQGESGTRKAAFGKAV